MEYSSSIDARYIFFVYFVVIFQVLEAVYEMVVPGSNGSNSEVHTQVSNYYKTQNYRLRLV